MLVEVLIPMSVFATIFGVIYLYLTTRNRERMAMIEQGADPELFVVANSNALLRLIDTRTWEQKEQGRS